MTGTHELTGTAQSGGTHAPTTPTPYQPKLFQWSQMASYTSEGRFLDGNDARYFTLFSPRDGDGLHRLLVDLVGSTQHSYVGNMYGFTDPDLARELMKVATNPSLYFQQSLDSSQAQGQYEKQLLQTSGLNAKIGSSIAIGTSIKHAISHLKVCIIDGVYTVSGSTNWSLGGEEDQDNEVTISSDPIRAAEFRAQLDRNHDAMLKQMAAAAGQTAPLSAVAAKDSSHAAAAKGAPVAHAGR